MGLIGRIIGKEANELAGTIGSVVDSLSTSQEEKLAARNQVAKLVNDSLLKVMDIQSGVMKTEMQGSILQRNWRPIVMLLFTLLLCVRWTGWVSHEISEALEMQLMEIMKIALGGYIVGRSVEKVSNTVIANMDLPLLKKKDRKLVKFEE